MPDSATFAPPDPLVVNPGRLSILMALSAADVAGVEFVALRRQTRLTDGNLASHARRLAAGGLVDVSKQFRAGKPVTTYLLTSAGREALRSHVRSVLPIIGHPKTTGGPTPAGPARMLEPVPALRHQPPPDDEEEEEEDWID